MFQKNSMIRRACCKAYVFILYMQHVKKILGVCNTNLRKLHRERSNRKNYLKMMKRKSDYELGNIEKASKTEVNFT